ncbi:MAG: AbrB/MazE/SpoVT family DNA-binding domain-containing protein [Acidobacteria bacterium]|nr:AbrB/MazE/SpoVT family DNA-binding domain-containing protein [Acidobacteriota bacterium]
MKTTAKLSSKSQITVPSWVRRALGIGPGSRVALRLDDGRLIIERVEDSIDRLCGALRGVYGDPDRYVREMRREWDRYPLD